MSYVDVICLNIIQYVKLTLVKTVAVLLWRKLPFCAKGLGIERQRWDSKWEVGVCDGECEDGEWDLGWEDGEYDCEQGDGEWEWECGGGKWDQAMGRWCMGMESLNWEDREFIF